MICDVTDSSNTTQTLVLNKSGTIVSGEAGAACIATRLVGTIEQDSTIFLLQKNNRDYTYLSMLSQDEKIIGPIVADQYHYFSEQFHVEQIGSMFLITQKLDALRNRYLLINTSGKKIEPDPGFHFVGKSTFGSTVFLHQQDNIGNMRYLLVSPSGAKIQPNIDDQCMNYEKINDQTRVVRWQHKNGGALMYTLIDIDGNITSLKPMPGYEFRGGVEHIGEYLILPQQEIESGSVSYAVVDKTGSVICAIKDYKRSTQPNQDKYIDLLDGTRWNISLAEYIQKCFK